MNLLIVEDERSVADLYIRLLGPLCESITVVKTLEELDAFITVGHGPDIVIFDLIGGEQAAIDEIKAIREVNPNAIIIVISGRADPSIIKKAMERGADFYALKLDVDTREKLIAAILAAAKNHEAPGRISLIETLTESISKSKTQRLQ